jgi:hypothetical protein
MTLQLEDFGTALKHHYQVYLTDHEFLNKGLSPAQLRDYCYSLTAQKMPARDQKILQDFFEATEVPESLRQKIDRIDIDKLRPITNFFKNKSVPTATKSLNFIALLIDYEKRPWSAFRKESEKISIHSFNSIEKSTIGKPMEFGQGKKFKKAGIGIIGLIIMGLSSLLITKRLQTETNCMQWNGQKYIQVDCDTSSLGFTSSNNIILHDAGQFKLKKIQVNENTPFFDEGGNPLVFYYKKGAKKFEYFNTLGYYPNTNKPLKKVTHYHINKYIKMNNE